MAFLDSSSGSGQVRQPLVWITVQDSKINVLECEVHQSGDSSPGTFEATVALDDPTSLSAQAWPDTSPLDVNVVGDNGDGTQATLMQGTATKVHIDFGPRTVRVEGQDKAGYDAINTRSQASYPNQQIDSLAAQIAGQHGMGFSSDGGGSSGGSGGGQSNMAGRTYDHNDYNFMTDQQSDWDALQQLANQSGKRMFTHNGTLYFVTPGSSGSGGSFTVTYKPPSNGYDQANAMILKGTHDIQVAQGTQETGATYDTYDKSAHSDQEDGDQAVGGEGLGILGGGFPGEGQPGGGEVNAGGGSNGPNVSIGPITILPSQ